MIQHIEQDNYTGEKVTVNINQKELTFRLNRGMFLLKESKNEFSSVFSIFRKGDKERIGLVFEDKDSWAAIESGHGNMSREGKTAIEAAVKLICNLC